MLQLSHFKNIIFAIRDTNAKKYSKGVTLCVHVCVSGCDGIGNSWCSGPIDDIMEYLDLRPLTVPW